MKFCPDSACADKTDANFRFAYRYIHTADKKSRLTISLGKELADIALPSRNQLEIMHDYLPFEIELCY